MHTIVKLYVPSDFPDPKQSEEHRSVAVNAIASSCKAWAQQLFTTKQNPLEEDDVSVVAFPQEVKGSLVVEIVASHDNEREEELALSTEEFSRRLSDTYSVHGVDFLVYATLYRPSWISFSD